MLGRPVDLSAVTSDGYVVAGVADHISPWQNCYRSARLFGGDTRFVLSTSGHIASIVNPPTNPKATHQGSDGLGEDAAAWQQAHPYPHPHHHGLLVAGLPAVAGRAQRRREASPGRPGGWTARARWGAGHLRDASMTDSAHASAAPPRGPRRVRSSPSAVRTVDVDGQPLRVVVRPGDPSRTPLLLMNGIGASLETFEPLVDALDPEIEVIRFDAPGVGGSPLAAVPYRFPALARRITRLLDVLGHERVDVLGISWGGGLAQQFAFTRPRRCRRLVLVATGTGSLMVPAGPRTLARMLTPRRYLDQVYLTRVASELYGGSARTDAALVRRVLLTHGRAGSPRGYLYQLLACAGWTSLPFLPLVKQPTLVLAGDDDPLIPLVNGRLLVALIPRGRLHVYRGGHLELAADPERLVPAIHRFLR
jgi:poly(3-hydroxyalkanoate) depolymerase